MATVPCDLTLRILGAPGQVVVHRSIAELSPELFPYPGDSSRQTLFDGEPFLLPEGVYRVELANLANTPAIQVRGAELRLAPFNMADSVVVTRLLLFAGAVFVACGLLILGIAARRRLRAGGRDDA